MAEGTDLTDLSVSPFGLAKEVRDAWQLAAFNRLAWHHLDRCPEYALLSERMGWGHPPFSSLADIPFLPVRLFKHFSLLSVPKDQVVKTMTSSGTSGQQVSKIFLDKQTAADQTRVLSRLVAEFIGPKRLPMLVIDARSTVADRHQFSARTAGILGFSMFGRDVEFALDDNMELNEGRVAQFLERHPKEPILLFGFTYIVWKHLVLPLEAAGKTFPMNQGTLIHGGGWKQLQAQALEPQIYNERLEACTGLKRVHNYYGMVEQTGSIFIECNEGKLHASSFSEVIIRDPVSFRPLEAGKPGLIQLLSVIPRSYPGFSLLSEDVGEWDGEDNCPCGRAGRTFRVHGRIQNAETRGCSDTYSR